MTPDQRWFSIKEVSELLSVSRGIVERNVSALGGIEYAPKRYRIPLEGLELWLRLHRVRRPSARSSHVNSDALIERARRELR